MFLPDQVKQKQTNNSGALKKKSLAVSLQIKQA
jgi:hypothetical protein